MLRKLLLRDWHLHQKAIWPVLAIFAAFEIYFVRNAEHATVWVVFTALYISFQTIIPLTREDTFGAASWTCTLPVTRKDVVRARYVSAWVVFAAASILGLVEALVIPGSALAPSDLMRVDSLLVAAGAATVVLLLIFPFSIRYGFKGILFAGVGLQIVFGIVLVVGMARNRMADIEGGVAAVFRPIYSTVANLHAGLSAAAFLAVTLIFLFALNWASYRLALGLFLRREL